MEVRVYFVVKASMMVLVSCRGMHVMCFWCVCLCVHLFCICACLSFSYALTQLSKFVASILHIFFSFFFSALLFSSAFTSAFLIPIFRIEFTTVKPNRHNFFSARFQHPFPESWFSCDASQQPRRRRRPSLRQSSSSVRVKLNDA